MKNNGTYGLHIQQVVDGPNKGKWFFVGSIPSNLLNWVKPTTSDVMGGRVVNGLAPKKIIYDHVTDAIIAARVANARLCRSPKCACYKDLQPARLELFWRKLNRVRHDVYIRFQRMFARKNGGWFRGLTISNGQVTINIE